MRLGTPPDPIVVFPAKHPHVGDVSIWDDGNEATVAIGEITHGHFNPYDPSLSAEQVADQVATELLSFLEALFDDKVLLWRSTDGRAGGWRHLGEDGSLSIDSDTMTYLWSGPVTRLRI